LPQDGLVTHAFRFTVARKRELAITHAAAGTLRDYPAQGTRPSRIPRPVHDNMDNGGRGCGIGTGLEIRGLGGAMDIGC
jgi:hypothetical protein